MSAAPDPRRLADAERRAAFAAEHVGGRSNSDGTRILAFDVLAEYVDEIDDGNRAQIAWALLWAESREDLAPHEERLREDAWKKVNDDADRSEWERLGLRGNA